MEKRRDGMVKGNKTEGRFAGFERPNLLSSLEKEPREVAS